MGGIIIDPKLTQN